MALQVIDLLEQLLVQVFSARTIRFQNQKTCLQNPKSTIFGLPIQLVVLQVIDLYEQLDSKTRKLDVFGKTNGSRPELDFYLLIINSFGSATVFAECYKSEN